MQCVQPKDYYSAMKRNEIPEKAGWLNLEKTFLCEKGQIKKVKYRKPHLYEKPEEANLWS